MYRLNLPEKIKIYPIQHVIVLEPVYRNIKPLVYKIDTYRGQEEDKQQVLKIIGYKDVDNEIGYKVKQIGYTKTTQELLSNLENAIGKVQEYQKRVGQGVLKKDRQRTSYLRGTQEEQLLHYLELFPSLEILLSYYPAQINPIK